MIGKKQSLQQIILEFEINHMYFIKNNGYYGTEPKKVYKYFDAHKVAYKKSTSSSTFKKKAKKGSKKCGIISFWNNSYTNYKWDRWSGGLHTVAYKYNASTGVYLVYNLEYGITKPTAVKKIQDVYKDKKFIVGYWL